MATRENSGSILRPLADAMENFIKTIYYNWNKLPSYCEYEPIDGFRIGNSISVPIGKTKSDTIYLNINNSNPHTYLVGNTGSGKSTLLKCILATIIKNYTCSKIILLDYKRVELNLFKNCRNTLEYHYKSEDISDCIERIYQMTLNRYDILAERNQVEMNPYDKDMPTILVVIEEISLMDKQTMKVLRNIMAISRNVGIYILFTCQRPDNTVIDNVVKSLVGNRIVLKCETEKNSIISLDEVGAEKLKNQGEGYYKVNGEKYHFQSFYISDEILNEIIENNTNIINTSKVKSSDSNDEEWLNNL